MLKPVNKYLKKINIECKVVSPPQMCQSLRCSCEIYEIFQNLTGYKDFLHTLHRTLQSDGFCISLKIKLLTVEKILGELKINYEHLV